MDKERERTRERELAPWTERQGVISFVILLVLCLSFYVLGIFVGRWSNSKVTATANITSVATPIPSKRLDPTAANGATPEATEKPLIEQKKDFLPNNTEKFYIQVTSAPSQEEADKVVEKLRRLNIDSVHVVAPQENSVAQFYVVKVGPYDVDTARQVAEELEREHNFRGIQVMSRSAQ
ncbi:MAG: Sporulation related domain-containing protein [bacterium]|nr:MAG: Sporulation related domain-containing protein [bacterium]